MNDTTMVTKDRLEFDPIIPEDERRFYQKAYPNVNFVRERKVHCTVCKMHIGTAPSNESIIRMHPILRVTHCKKCHEFYNSGEFSKGEDGSELYCRWCGQGGEVYCCSNCPFVFCKSCIISNLSRGVVADIEQNENWSCFNCAPKMLWPLRAQHWALIKFIDKQKKAILNSNLSDSEIKTQMTKDRSLCCKIKKASGYGTDSSDSSDISLSRLKQKVGEKRSRKSLSKEDLSDISSPAVAKKTKTNDEVVCTPDVMSMLEPECQLTVAPDAKARPQPAASSPKIMSIPHPPKRTTPPPLLIRNAQIPQVRPLAPSPVIKKTIVGPRLPTTGTDFSTPVYHTINGYRIDLNSAAQQETVRLPNGKLIQVKRQGTGPQTVTTVQSAPNQQVTPNRVIHNSVAPAVSPIANVPTQQIVHSSGGHIIRAQLQTPRSITVQNPSIIPQFQQQTPQQYQQITIRQPNQQIATIRYQGASNQQVTNILQNGAVQLLNGTAVTTTGGQVATVRQLPTFVKQFFPNTPIGLSRTQLQNQIFSAMEICQHLMGKVQTLTNSNAYKTAKSLTDVKELYIHLSYLLTYAIGRFKGLQDNCLSDMRDLGFTNDANSLENGQLAAGMDMVRSGKITDFANIDLDNFHALIVQNMDLMRTAAADSSTADGKIEVKEGDEMSEKSEEPKYHELDVEEEKFKTATEYDIYENLSSPAVEIIEDDDDDCLLVEASKGTRDTEEYDQDASDDNQSDDECLLVECGERKPDDEWNPHMEQQNVSDDDEEDDYIVPGLSTSYENDDDYQAPPMSGFTHDLDTKLIELVKGMPPLWDPSQQRTNSSVQQEMWKKISRLMPSELNCRMRWKNLRYRYICYQKRVANNPSGEPIPPHRNAYLLKFLDKVWQQKAPNVSRVNPNESLERTTTSESRESRELREHRSDHDFIVKLIGVIEKYPSLWHSSSLALIRHAAQPEVWKKVHNELKDEGYKQASDAEEDEISIVEPKTDTINLDSDNEDESHTPVKPNGNIQQSVITSHSNVVINPVANTDNMIVCNQNPIITPTTTTNAQDELTAEYDFSKVANLLAGMLEVELTESGCAQPPKKPRKKTTNKPNPTLLKQKEMQERERLENIKKNDAKLKMQVQIPLNKVEDIYEYAKPLVDKLKHKKQENSIKVKNFELLAPLPEVEVQKKDEQVEKKEPEAAEVETKVSPPEKDIKDDNATEKTSERVDDKEESEEVVVLVVEDLDNSKEEEEAKNETEDNDDSVEIIEHEDSQDSDRDLLQHEDSVCSTDVNSAKGSITRDTTKEDEEEKKLNKRDAEKEVYKIAGEDEEEEETEVLMDFENNTCETMKSVKVATDLYKEKSDVIEIDTDPLQDENEKSLLVPAETQNTDNDVESSLDSSHSSHNIDLPRIMGRTEVV